MLVKHLIVSGSVAVLAACATVPPYAAPYQLAPSAHGLVFLASAASVRLLAAHNAERSRVGVPPLMWDTALAAQATAYAAQLARLGILRHSDRRARGGSQGENLWMGSRGAYSPEQMVAGWASERRMFRAGKFPAVSRADNWADVAHYTQMIWRGSQRLGCGIASSSRYDVLVCRYSPAGNIDGRPVP